MHPMLARRALGLLALCLFVLVFLAPAGAQPQDPAPADPAGISSPAPTAAPAEPPAASAPQKPAVVDPTVQALRESAESTRATLDSIEGALAVEGLRVNDLEDLRSRLDPIRRELAAGSEALNARLTRAKARLQELGAPPAEEAPAEDPSITADREHFQALADSLETTLKQNRALVLRAEQISESISARRRALFAGQLFGRSASILDPNLWTDAFAALQVELRSLRYLGLDWHGFATRRLEGGMVAAIFAGAAAIFAVLLLLGNKLRSRFRTAPPPEGTSYSRYRAARESLKSTLFDSLIFPVAAGAALALLFAFDVVPPRGQDVLRGLMVAVVIQSVGYAIGHGVLAPNEPWRRLPPIRDISARVSYRYFAWTVWALSIAAFLNSLHRALFVPVALTVTTSAVMSLLISGFIARSLIVLARAGMQEDEDTDGSGSAVLPSMRIAIWLCLAVLVAALVAGYVSFAAFVSARLVIAAGVIGFLYLLIALVDSFVATLSTASTHARMVSKTLGLKANRLELMALLIAALVKVILVLLAILLIAGSWGTSTADVMESIERVSFGVRIGNSVITPWNVMYALILMLVGVVLARGLQRWISGQILPRAGIEPGLQASITTVVGYVGTIIAMAIAMSELGLNLENIALVAGALSVGIGFGLQSIVSNFVSGLILLAERPIRVGDTINVKGEEGYVRRISVRSTEIETFERATVIVPNSDLITGMVKNFTHSNTTGRVIVTINAAYDADAEHVRDILVACACDHPQVLQTPPPRVFLTKFADAGIVFELRCVVANVDYGLTVKSDLHLQVLSRFREAGIGMACQPWAALGRAARDMVPPPPAPASPPPLPSPAAAEAAPGPAAG